MMAMAVAPVDNVHRILKEATISCCIYFQFIYIFTILHILF